VEIKWKSSYAKKYKVCVEIRSTMTVDGFASSLSIASLSALSLEKI